MGSSRDSQERMLRRDARARKLNVLKYVVIGALAVAAFTVAYLAMHR